MPRALSLHSFKMLFKVSCHLTTDFLCSKIAHHASQPSKYPSYTPKVDNDLLQQECDVIDIEHYILSNIFLQVRNKKSSCLPSVVGL